MARQEETCWGCGAEWAPERMPSKRLHVIRGGGPAAAVAAGAEDTATVVLANAAGTSEARADTDRRSNEGGRFAFEADASLGAASQ
jgi:hypothetical protein